MRVRSDNKKKSGGNRKNKGLFSLSVLTVLLVYLRVFGLLKTDEILERCGY